MADIRKWALPATAVGSKAPQRPAYVPVDGDDDGRVRRNRETRSLMRWSRKARCATIVAVAAAVVTALSAADAHRPDGSKWVRSHARFRPVSGCSSVLNAM